jgi:Outer membrane protein beta-barrel family/Carboxypeptidase regulatory-like domain
LAKLVLILLYCLAACSTAKAQTILKGNVIDKNGRAIELVTLSLQKDSVLLKMSATDSNGSFVFADLPKGSYRLIASYLNYTPRSIDLMLSSDTLVSVMLEYNGLQMADVRVSAKKSFIEKKIDRIVFNLGNNTVLMGANAIDVLNRTPLVSASNGAIRIIGKSNARVMINEKLLPFTGEDLFSYLKSIPANSIVKVEVITNPSAKYDAAGNAGLINIITYKSSKKGFTGLASATYDQTFYATGETALSMTSTGKKTTFFAALSYRNGKTRPLERLNVQYASQYWKQTTYRTQLENRLSYQAGIDYNINKNNVLSITFIGSLSKPAEPATGKTYIFNNSNALDSFFLTSNTIKQITKIHDININYKLILDSAKGKKLSLNADYLSYNNQKNQDLYTENFFPDYTSTNYKIDDRSLAPQIINIYTTMLDYEAKYKALTYNVGVKLTSIDMDNNFKYLINKNLNDPTKSNHFLYTEKTMAAYVSATFPAKKFTFQLGLRAEKTWFHIKSLTQNTQNRNSYLKPFPSAFIDYKLSKDDVLSLSYGKRINRPGYWELNPFRYFLNAYQYAEGNPNLAPSFTNNFELSYTMKNKYIFNLFYDFTTNIFLQIPIEDPITGAINFTRKNVGRKSGLGGYLVAPIVVNKWWDFDNTIAAYALSEKSNYLGNPIKYNVLVFSYSLTNNFVLSSKKNYLATIGFQYNSNSRNYLYKVSSTYYIDVGLRFPLFKQKLNVGINCSDILYSANAVIESVKNTITPIQFANLNDNRTLRISAIYKFGTGKGRKEKSRSNKEERNRIK